ncbi:MAG TPA: transglycosylase family protein [Pseudonocardiaceae bacterium]|nr:transglycosylase family protein [Pseudonocardiaceae bacterium]
MTHLRRIAGPLVGSLVTTLLTAVVVPLALPGTASADPAASSWSRLRDCESGGNYAAVSGSGRYYGAYQFDVGTWRSVGGAGYPNQASPLEQDYRALYLYRMRGWRPWTCAATLGLRTDGDAASHRVPSYADAARITGGGPAAAVAPGAPGVPGWPGRVYRPGNCDPALRTWQLRMNAFGFRFAGTGCYETKTVAAVAAVQRANGITNEPGQLGPRTWTAAWAGHAPKP